MFKKTTTIAILAVLALSFSAVSADMVPLDKTTQGDGNKGVSFRPWTDATHVDVADFVITARTGINELAPLVANATGLMGTVCIDKDGPGGKVHGAGVQDLAAGGSKGISGGGPARDEELIFTYDQAVYLRGLSIRLGDIEFEKVKHDGKVEAKDDPVIFLQTAGSSTFDVVITEADIATAFSYIGDPKNKYGEVDFNSFITTGGLADDEAIIAFAVRETNDHIYVNGVSSDEGNIVPEPATMTLLACGGLVLAGRRRRNRA